MPSTFLQPVEQRCTAHNRQGERCGNWAVNGAKVCRLHGGLSPNAQRAAKLHLLELEQPAIATLAKVMADPKAKGSDKVRAAVAVLSLLGHNFDPRDRIQITPEEARQQLLDYLLAQKEQAQIVDGEVEEPEAHNRNEGS